MEPRIIFEDEWLVVIDKPAGMVTNRSKTTRGETVQEWFESKLQSDKGTELQSSEFTDKGGVVHRLDKETSGVLVLAKTPQVYENLKSQFLERKVTKVYIALVHGQMPQEEGIISTPITRNPKIYGKFMVGGELSRTAVTNWKVLKEYTVLNAQYSLLEVTPLTGRTHQIRVHLTHLGHPIAGDSLYGMRKQITEERKWCPRLFLHATSLTFSHPVTLQKMKVVSPIPSQLDQVLGTLVH
jgi:23S rRNA pseudouridine1911/1915/1917 synthase